MGFLFWFKKTVSRFLFPAPLIFYCLVGGVLLLWFGKSRPRFQKAGKILLGCGVGLFVLFTSTGFPDLLLKPLERKYPVFSLETVQRERGSDWRPEYIVVLGGAFRPDPDSPITSRVGQNSTGRVAEGVRLFREFPESTLVFTGATRIPDAQSSGDGMAELAEVFGVSRESMYVDGESYDTKDHVRYLQPVIGDSPFIIVTSASHLPRAMALFRHAGLDPVAAPVHFEGQSSSALISLPRSANLMKTEVAFYEYLGLIWAKLRGQI